MTLVGWREWIALPDWDVPALKAKIDTGARTSAIHATDIEPFALDDAPWVRFTVHPWQRSDADPSTVEAPLVDERTITSSSGDRTDRLVVCTTLTLAGRSIDAEVTLTRRDEMGFRMLIGREALRQGFLVDPSRSYLGGKPPRDVRRRNRAHVAGDDT
ncbi:MAG: ATP-dependent zinc protease [Ilumatobacter sp.]